MRAIGFITILAGAVMMAVSFFSSSYDEFDRLQVLTKEIERQNSYLSRGQPLPTDPIPAREFNPEKAQRRQFGFMGGGFLIVAGSVFAAVGSRRRRITSGSTAPPQPLPGSEDPPAPEV